MPADSHDVLDKSNAPLLAGGLVYGTALFVVPVTATTLDLVVGHGPTPRWHGASGEYGRDLLIGANVAKQIDPIENRTGLCLPRSWSGYVRKKIYEDSQADGKMLGPSVSFCTTAMPICSPRKFPKATFDAFVAKYMGDERTPEYVEERSQQLQQITGATTSTGSNRQNRPTRLNR